MTYSPKRITDKHKTLKFMREAIIVFTFVLMFWQTIGKPTESIATWAFKLGTLSDRFSTHCKTDSTFRLDIQHFMDVSAQDRHEIWNELRKR